MGVHNTYLHFVEMLSWMQCHPHLSMSLSLQVGIMSQLLVLGLF